MINYKTQRKNNQTRNPPKNDMDYPGWPISKGRGGWWSWSCFVRKQIHEFAKKPRCVSSQHQSATCGSLPSHAFNELCKCLNCFCCQGISCMQRLNNEHVPGFEQTHKPKLSWSWIRWHLVWPCKWIFNPLFTIWSHQPDIGDKPNVSFVYPCIFRKDLTKPNKYSSK